IRSLHLSETGVHPSSLDDPCGGADGPLGRTRWAVPECAIRHSAKHALRPSDKSPEPALHMSLFNVGCARDHDIHRHSCWTCSRAWDVARCIRGGSAAASRTPPHTSE